jgi:hypothetical protein
VISSPEHNASMPGVLKNAIDWVSRHRPQPFNEMHGLLMSASPSMVGGNRGLWSLRTPFEHLGARIYPDMLSLAQAHLALDDDGAIANEGLPTTRRGPGRVAADDRRTSATTPTSASSRTRSSRSIGDISSGSVPTTPRVLPPQSPAWSDLN